MNKNKKKTVFNAKGLEEEGFKSWLTNFKFEKKERCRICKEDIELSNIGRQAHFRHCNRKKNKGNNVIKIKSFFEPVSKSFSQSCKNI